MTQEPTVGDREWERAKLRLQYAAETVKKALV